MAKKGKNKGSTKKQNERGKDGSNKIKQGKKAVGNLLNRNSRKKSNSNWTSLHEDPVRRAVEADGSRTIVEMNADGNCLFRSLSDQLHQDFGSKHEDVRTEVCDYLEKHEEDFSIFLVLDEDEDDEDAADFESYVSAMREDGEWGGNVELVAAARLYQRNIMVFSADLAAFTIPHGEKGEPVGPDLYLSYHDNDHYNSVRSSNGKTSNQASEPTSNKEHLSKARASDAADVRSTRKKSGSNKASAPSAKKSDPCPCGSGQKYKKCCWTKHKQAARLQKRQGKSPLDNEEIEPTVMDGAFRVMAI